MTNNDQHSEYGGGPNNSEFLPDGTRRIPNKPGERAQALRSWALGGEPPPEGMRDSAPVRK